MNQTNRLMLKVLTRITTTREAMVVWVLAGIVICAFLYYNQRID